MMAGRAENSPLEWEDNEGRNGIDTPDDISDDMCAEAINIVLTGSTLGAKRPGSSNQALTGTFSGFNAMARFSAAQDDTAAQLIVVDRSATAKIGRVTAGTAFTNLTLSDNFGGGTETVADFAVLNGKCYIAYGSSVDRLHVYDPSESTTLVRRVGFPLVIAAPTVANTGSGSYAATARFYRIVYAVVASSVIRRRSNLGTPSATFTPSGSGLAARVSQGAVPGEGETHWIVYGSSDGVIYYNLSGNIAIGTTTYDDSAVVGNYSLNDPAPDEGSFTAPNSYKFLATDGNRLLGFGAWETTSKNGRVWFSPALDSAPLYASDDDERVSNTTTFQGWIDIQRNGGYEDRAIIGPLDAAMFVFQSRGITMLVQTGDGQTPYRRVTLHPIIGALSQASCCMGEDESGRPCIYFLDPERGPYRYGSNGLEWCGYDVQDVWMTVNQAAKTRFAFAAHAKYVSYSTGEGVVRRVLFWIPTGVATDPNKILVFDVQRGVRTARQGVRKGWTVWTGDLAMARCSVLFAETFGATMSRTQKVYGGTATKLLRAMDTTASDDDGTAYQAFVTSKAWDAGIRHKNKKVVKSWVQAGGLTGKTLTQTLSRNFSEESRTSSVDLTASGAQTRIFKQFDTGQLVDGSTFQTTLGDASALVTGQWFIDRWTCTVELAEEV